MSAALSLVLLLALAACGSQPTPTQESAQPEPTAASEPEMNRDGLPSETLQGVYNELAADYSSYSQTKSYYDECMPDVKYTEALEDVEKSLPNRVEIKIK